MIYVTPTLDRCPHWTKIDLVGTATKTGKDLINLFFQLAFPTLVVMEGNNTRMEIHLFV